MKSVAIIPARMAATRFPGKPMAKINGMPMIGHIYKRATLENIFDEVYVATCDQEILDYIHEMGGKAVMTADTHERCTDRAAEALSKIEKIEKQIFDIVGMVQGDEPTVSPQIFKDALKELKENPNLPLVNIMNRVNSVEEFESANNVKVVIDKNNDAIYFSREPIPSRKKFNDDFPKYRQTGMIFFRKENLIAFNEMEPTDLEKIESVDMNRLVENGTKIRMILSEIPCLPVDVPSDLDRVNHFFETDELIKKYL